MRLKWLSLLPLAIALPLQGAAQSVKIVVQDSTLAGFRFHAAPTVWEEMKVGDPLSLVREAGNAHDTNAIRVEWHGRKLGYVPRGENAALAREMDRGARIGARIARLDRHLQPWRRIRFEVFVVP